MVSQRPRAAACVETRASSDGISGAAHPVSFAVAQAPSLILAAGAPDRAQGRARPGHRNAGAPAAHLPILITMSFDFAIGATPSPLPLAAALLPDGIQVPVGGSHLYPVAS